MTLRCATRSMRTRKIVFDRCAVSNWSDWIAYPCRSGRKAAAARLKSRTPIRLRETASALAVPGFLTIIG